MSKVAAKPYHHGSLREALVDEARRVVRESGGAAVSLRELTRSLGVSPNAPYRHFPDREALLREVAREGFADLLADFRACGDEPTLEEIGVAYVTFAHREPLLWQLMFSAVCADGEPEQDEAFLFLLRTVAQRLNLPPDHPKTMEGALAAWCLVHGLATLRLTAPDTVLSQLEPAKLPVFMRILAALTPPEPKA